MEDWVFPVVCLLLGVIILSSRQFFRRRRGRDKENGKRSAALIEEVRGWVYEDLEKRADLVCIAAVVESLAQYGVERAEKQWRFMMTEDNSSEQSSEEG